MIDPKWLTIARGELGVHETPGPAATARIAEYHGATSLHATSDEVPWCASFVSWCLEQAGVRSTRSAAAASYAAWGAACVPQPGAIVVLRHKTAGADAATGSSSGNHVGFWVGADPAHVHILGGNQSDSVKESAFPLEKYEVAACRWPVLT